MEGKLVNQYMSEKAGMGQVDKKTIAETIEKLTAGTPKSLHEQEMQQKRSLEVTEMLKKCFAFSIEQKEVIKKDWWKEMNEMRRTRELGRYWAHFDFDMFYIACELLDRYAGLYADPISRKNLVPWAVRTQSSALLTTRQGSMG